MIRRFDSAASFLVTAGPFLSAREAEHNLIHGITSNLIADDARGVAIDPLPYLAVAVQLERIVAAAIMTPPFNLVLSCIAEAVDGAGVDAREAIAEFAADVATFEIPPPGVLGPVDIAAAFAGEWCRGRKLVPERTMAERIYRLERVIPPTGVPGHVRIGSAADRDLLIDFCAAFLREVDRQPDKVEARSMVDRGLDAGQRTFFLWESDGQTVSMAAAGGPTPNGIRIGPVYTPPEFRAHGFASAVTAAATQAQLDEGRRFVFLFTDLANPTSNKIYQAIGYEPVIDVDMITFRVSDDVSSPL
jgi:GNAT superfamily N-acetyltransferase